MHLTATQERQTERGVRAWREGRGRERNREGSESREGIEVHVSTGYWLPGELEGWREISGTTS